MTNGKFLKEPSYLQKSKVESCQDLVGSTSLDFYIICDILIFILKCCNLSVQVFNETEYKKTIEVSLADNNDDCNLDAKDDGMDFYLVLKDCCHDTSLEDPSIARISIIHDNGISFVVLLFHVNDFFSHSRGLLDS